MAWETHSRAIGMTGGVFGPAPHGEDKVMPFMGISKYVRPETRRLVDAAWDRWTIYAIGHCDPKTAG